MKKISSQHNAARHFKLRYLGLAIASLCAAGFASGAMAQAVTGSAPAAAEEEIVVSASRIGRSGFAAPTPTTMMGAEDFQSRAATNVTGAFRHSHDSSGDGWLGHPKSRFHGSKPAQSGALQNAGFG